MMREIDGLVSQILYALKEEDEPPSQLDGLLKPKPLALRGIERARDLRRTLETYANDTNLDIRNHAKQKLKQLPKF
jgi:hypothetical protein